MSHSFCLPTDSSSCLHDSCHHGNCLTTRETLPLLGCHTKFHYRNSIQKGSGSHLSLWLLPIHSHLKSYGIFQFPYLVCYARGKIYTDKWNWNYSTLLLSTNSPLADRLFIQLQIQIWITGRAFALHFVLMKASQFQELLGLSWAHIVLLCECEKFPFMWSFKECSWKHGGHVPTKFPPQLQLKNHTKAWIYPKTFKQRKTFFSVFLGPIKGCAFLICRIWCMQTVNTYLRQSCLMNQNIFHKLHLLTWY